MDDKRQWLRHFLATLAYRARKAIGGTSESFGSFDAGYGVRRPIEIISHMSAVLTHAQSFFAPSKVPPGLTGTWQGEVERFFTVLSDLDKSFELAELKGRTEEQMLQGPLADAMTHVGQLAILRRIASLPIPKEDFDEADIRIGDIALHPSER